MLQGPAIAAFFGIAPEMAEKAAAQPRRAKVRRAAAPRATARPRPADGVQAVIEKGLRAAGLMR